MAVLHDQAADIGIGRGKPPPAFRKGDGGGHVTPVLRGIGGGQYGFRSDGFGSGAQGWAAPLWVGAGADFSVASALARRRSSCARSEEHTSELQPLMRISLAVFFLEK